MVLSDRCEVPELGFAGNEARLHGLVFDFYADPPLDTTAATIK